MVLDYERAERVLQASMAKANELGAKVSIAVLDDNAQPVAVAKMTGARRGTSSWACIGKAMVSAVWGTPSADVAGRLPKEVLEHGQAMYGHRLLFLRGGIPLKDGDTLMGAVATSGGTGEQDEEIAQAGADAF